MNKEQFRKQIKAIFSHVLFTYNGKNCGIDPFSATNYDMWYGDKSITVHSIDEVMDSPFFDGKSLVDIAEEIEDIEF